MTSDLQSTTQRSWKRFLETYEPLRSELYRYCRHLTRSPWDAEDLAGELGVPVRVNGQRWWRDEPSLPEPRK